MTRLVASLLALAVGMHMTEVAARPPGPICRLPTVVDAMARELGARVTHARRYPTIIDEAPTPDGRVVRCGVCLTVVFYDTARYGEQPLARCEAHDFSVEAVRNGFVVRQLQ